MSIRELRAEIDRRFSLPGLIAFNLLLLGILLTGCEDISETRKEARLAREEIAAELELLREELSDSQNMIQLLTLTIDAMGDELEQSCARR